VTGHGLLSLLRNFTSEGSSGLGPHELRGLFEVYCSFSREATAIVAASLCENRTLELMFSMVCCSKTAYNYDLRHLQFNVP